MKKHPALIVLQALLQGQTIEMGDFAYTIAEDEHGNQRVWLANTITPGWLGNITLDKFIQQCNAMPEQELFLIGANNALNSMRQESVERSVT